jgi:hypothetical protein
MCSKRLQVLLHACKEFGAAVYLDPSAYCSGWVDNALKALLRDGHYFFQDETVQYLKALCTVF